MTNQDPSVKLLIEHVRERIALWDLKQQSIPGIKKVQQRLWTDVAGLHNSTVEDIKKRWANLRNAFTKQLNKVPKNKDNKFEYDPNRLKTNWPHYESLLFLVNPKMMPSPLASQTIKKERSSLTRNAGKRRLNDNDPDVSNNQENDEVGTKRRRLAENTNLFSDDAGPSSNQVELPTSNSSSLNDMISEEVAVTPEFINNFDSDQQWLVSFADFLRPLKVADKLKVRLAVTNAFIQSFNDIIEHSEEC